MDLDKTTRLVSEELARSLGRRGFLKRAGQTVFYAVAALASGHMLSKEAAASGKVLPKAPPDPGRIGGDIRCNPPNATYCNRGGGDLTGCHGGQCNSHSYNGKLYSCDRDYTYYPGTGCWTTATSNGYWTCCDCKCTYVGASPTVCGCAQFSSRPLPGVDNPIKGN